MKVATPRLRALGLGGSLRRGSFSHLALHHVLGLLRAQGCETSVFDLRDRPLPFCNGDKTDPRSDYPAVAELRQLVRESHALVLATPEYHGSVSGVLKNALDLLDFEHLEGKVVGAISVLGGQTNSNALNDLRTILRWCHAWVIPEQIAVGRVRTAFVEGRLSDPDLLQRFEVFARSLVRNTRRLKGDDEAEV